MGVDLHFGIGDGESEDMPQDAVEASKEEIKGAITQILDVLEREKARTDQLSQQVQQMAAANSPLPRAA